MVKCVAVVLYMCYSQYVINCNTKEYPLQEEKLMQRKEVTSIRLTPEARTLLQRLAEMTGLSQAGVLETMIRDRAKREDIKPPDSSHKRRVSA